MNTRSGNRENYKTVKYSQRLIVRYNFKGKYKYFYRSTGLNSTLKNTWFPCDGIQRKDYKSKMGERKKGWIKKPCSFRLWLFFNEKNINHPELERFGTLSDMAISAKIGGGFWDLEESDVFKQHINVKDSDDTNYHVRFLKNALVDEDGLENLSIEQVLKEL